MTTDLLSRATSDLVRRGNHRGFLTMAEVQQELEDIKAPGEAFEKVADELRGKGIKLQEEGPGVHEEIVEVPQVSISDPVRLYLNEIGRSPLLTAQQEVELSMQMEAGRRAEARLDDEDETLGGDDKAFLSHEIEIGETAHKQLVQSNLRLVVALARRYVGRGMALLDLIQEGNVGLMRAVERFDYRRGFKFSTYATWWIRQSISRAIADQGRTIRMPIHVLDSVNKLTRVQRELTQVHGRAPTLDELAVELGLDTRRVAELRRIALDTVSLEAPVGEGEDGTLADMVVDPEVEAPIDAASFVSLQDQLAEVLEGLGDREREVLIMRFGLADGRARTLGEVGAYFNVTRERIRQLELKALAKLRHPDKSEKLLCFLEDS